MSCITYVWKVSIKNRFRELLRKPALLILYIVLIALLVALIIFSKFSNQATFGSQSLFILKLLFFALIAFFAGTKIHEGFSDGGSFFDMCDVNFMFVAPINPRIILIHGVARQITTAFLVSFFLLFQTQSLKVTFGVEFSGVLCLLLGFLLIAILSEIIAMTIYSLTNGNRKRKMVAKAMILIPFLPAVVFWLSIYFKTRDAQHAAVVLAQSMYLDIIPVVGWTARGSFALLYGHVAQGLFWLSFTVIAGILLIFIIGRSKSDYYEDVLSATAFNFEKKRAKAEGNMSALAAASRRKVSVGGVGLAGWGAGVFTAKHLRESFRENRMKLFDMGFVITLATGILVAFISRPIMNSIFILGLLMWVRIFLVGTGRGLRELLTHYVYMVPESPLKKMLYCNGENMLRTTVEAIILFGFFGFFCKDTIAVAVCCALVYILFHLLLISINYVSMRLFRQTLNQGLLLLIYFILTLAAMLPGLVGGIVAGIFLSPEAGLMILALWEVAASVIFFYLSRNVLHQCDMISIMKKS